MVDELKHEACRVTGTRRSPWKSLRLAEELNNMGALKGCVEGAVAQGGRRDAVICTRQEFRFEMFRDDTGIWGNTKT